VTLVKLDLVAVLELVLMVLLAVGVGLLVGAWSVVAGVGAGLAVFALVGFVLVIAYEKGAS
jgi:hypothetical protein